MMELGRWNLARLIVEGRLNTLVFLWWRYLKYLQHRMIFSMGRYTITHINPQDAGDDDNNQQTWKTTFFPIYSDTMAQVRMWRVLTFHHLSYYILKYTLKCIPAGTAGVTSVYVYTSSDHCLGLTNLSLASEYILKYIIISWSEKHLKSVRK